MSASGDVSLNGIPNALVRGRILAAMAELTYARRCHLPSVSEVIRRARVSRATFYALFSDRDDCLLAAFEDAVARATVSAKAEYERERLWAERIRAGLLAVLEFFDEHPQLAVLSVVVAPAGGARLMARRRELMTLLSPVLQKGRGMSARKLSPITEEATIGGVLAVIHRRLLTRDPEPLSTLVNPLMAFIVNPYLGVSKASRELVRLPRRSQVAPTKREPLAMEAPVRLTHRSLPALLAIADAPGLSNREVATAAGVSDQAQICRLLSRLCSVGLLRNTGAGQPAGGPNAWALTAQGDELVRTIRETL